MENFIQSQIGLVLFILLMLWTMVWKGLALWKSARSNKQVWFIVLLIVNTLGILEILYIYIFDKEKKPNQEQLNINK